MLLFLRIDIHLSSVRGKIFFPLTWLLSYRLIALAPNTPATAEATAMTTFRIISQRDFFIAIIYTPPFRYFKRLITSWKRLYTFAHLYCPHRLSFTSKQGHALIHSSGSISPSPFRSGLRSRCPHTRQPEKRCFNWYTSSRSEAFCSGVRVSAGRPRQSRPPS